MNIVQLYVECEDGCTIERNEFSLDIAQFIGSLSIDDNGGCDDVSLIKECCSDYLYTHKEYFDMEPAFTATLTIEESGEWEDVFWHKYYVVKKAEFFIV